ncbi:MAG TPA: hypothetical protein VI479_14440 [Blastocatellia bacterium]
MSDVIVHNDRGEMAGNHDANGAEPLHEPNAVSIPGVVKFLVWLSAAIVVAALSTWGLFRYFDARKAREAPPPSPLAAGARLPPEPRLQGAPGSASSPAEDIRRFREREDQMLDSYGWIDRQNGVIRIPIEQAKRLILQRGLMVTPPKAPQDSAAQGAEKKP